MEEKYDSREDTTNHKKPKTTVFINAETSTAFSRFEEIFLMNVCFSSMILWIPVGLSRLLVPYYEKPAVVESIHLL